MYHRMKEPELIDEKEASRIIKGKVSSLQSLRHAGSFLLSELATESTMSNPTS
jgi:hypothetical protein